jgi:hypothetical protein
MSDKLQDENVNAEFQDADSGDGDDTLSTQENQKDTAAQENDATQGDVIDEVTDSVEPLNEEDLIARTGAEIRSNRLEHLRQSIINAQTLLAFSTESDVEVPDNVVAGITEAQREIGKDSWTPAIETAFWSAYGDISRLVQPVTSNSVEWTSRHGRKVTIWFILFGVISLLCLFGMQIVWVYVNGTSIQIDKSITDLNKKEAEFLTLKGRVALVEPTVLSQFETPEKIPDSEIENRKKARENLNADKVKIQTLDSEISQIKRLLSAQYKILAGWVPEIGNDPKPKAPGWFDSEVEAQAKSKALKNWYEAQERQPVFHKEYLLAQAKSFQSLMLSFFLPLFYGMLGTAAFILRSVARSIRERTLDGSITLNFLVRIPLGMLSGIAVGLFLDPKSLPTGWEAVQPVAFAFLAGYSVELIFTAMDRLVGAFTGRNQRGTPDPIRRPAG